MEDKKKNNGKEKIGRKNTKVKKNVNSRTDNLKKSNKKISNEKNDIKLSDKKNDNKLKQKKKKVVKNSKKDNKLFSYIVERVFYVFFGIVLTCVIFFILTGGKNYFKLYYELKRFIDSYDAVTSDYYGDFNKEDLISGAIDSMLVSIGDDYTTYQDKNSTDEFLENINGTYEGIGCMVATDVNGNIVVVEVFDNTPSSKAGLEVNDFILKVDDVDFTDKTSLEISEYIKNSKAAKIVLKIKRGEEILDVNINREKIDIPVIHDEILQYSDKKIGYISIDVFSSISYKQIKSKLKKLEKEGISGLIVDVRGNNGGYLSAVTDISNLFLKKGKVIYQLEDNKSKEDIKDTTKEYRDYPIAVLVDGGSASASEIFAAAIKESYGGYVVGVNTYGKGTVQKTKVLSDGSMIKYTVQKWLTPKGNFINEIGLEPTNIVEYDYNSENDNQLDLALELVGNNKK